MFDTPYHRIDGALRRLAKKCPDGAADADLLVIAFAAQALQTEGAVTVVDQPPPVPASMRGSSYELTARGRRARQGIAAASDVQQPESCHPPRGRIPPGLHELLHAIATDYRRAVQLLNTTLPNLRQEAKDVLGLGWVDSSEENPSTESREKHEMIS